ncbi:MAG: SBBP repeat-containing protein, partial [Methanophagales archaeon]|nr:SBBP repeat-containing protein [Methanophagales archaeon]
MKMTEQIWNVATVLLTAGMLTAVLFSGALASPAAAVDETAILENAVKLQVPFIENQGQIEKEAVRFYARTFGGTLFVEDSGEENVYVACNFDEVGGTGVGSPADGYDTSYNGDDDVYLIKLNSGLTTRSHSTFLGSSGVDSSTSISVDNSGNVYVAGDTYSSGFPTTSSAYDETFNGGDCDAFVSKLDSNLSAAALAAPPNITSFAPPSPVNDTVCNWRTFNVTVNQTVNVSWYLNGTLQQTNESVQAAICTLHADAAGVHNVTAIASNGNGSDMQTWIWNVTEESSHTFELYTGWNMISFPVDPLDKDPDNIFGPGYYQLVTWDPVSGSYVAVDEVETGIGYWLLVTEDRSVTVLGVPISEYYTGLIQGWNMIGSLWTATNVPGGTETIPPNQMHPSLYTWNVDHYDTTQAIGPGLGYWALAYVDCELHVFPAPPAAPLPVQQITWGDNDWHARLALTSGAGTDVAE